MKKPLIFIIVITFILGGFLMAKIDRTVFTTNDQDSGQIADPNKLEANDSHIADVVDANDTEYQSHKTNKILDHPDGSVTTSKLADDSVTRAKVATGAIGENELDDYLLQQYGDIATNAKFNEVDSELEEIPKKYGHRFAKKLGTRLSAGYEDTDVLVLGDSTGNESHEWVYLLTQWLATQYPSYKVLYRLWDDATQDYGTASTIQSGTGTTRVVNTFHDYAILDGDGDYLKADYNANKVVTGDLDVRVKVASDDWYAAGTAKTLVDTFGNVSGKRGWNFSIDSGGDLYLWWSEDGTNQIIERSTIVLPSAVNGESLWVRVVLDVDNGSGGYDILFYYSSDGESWTQLGTTITGASPTNIYQSTNPLTIGVRGVGSEPLAGKFYEAVIKDGIEGKTLFHPVVKDGYVDDIDDNKWILMGHAKCATSVTTNEPPILTVYNGSKGGANVAYATDKSRFDLLTPTYPEIVFLSFSHNEGGRTDYETTYKYLIDKVLTKYRKAGIVCIAQNPQRSPEVNIIPHAIRGGQVSMVASNYNYGFVDVFKAFMETGDLSSYMVDGAHPNQAGSELWRDEVIKYLKPITN